MMFKKIPGFDLRDDQLRILDKVAAAYDKGVDTVILQAPTGTGKSVLARSITTAFQSSYLLTPTRSLQSQYWADFKTSGDIALFMGKTNYSCQVFKDAFGNPPTVEEASCQFERSGEQIKECKEEAVCPYYNARARAIDSSCTIMSFQAYLLWRLIGQDQEMPYFNKRHLHVIDEAHRIEDVVTDFLAIKLSEGYLRKVFRRRADDLPPMRTEGTPEDALVYLLQVRGLIEDRLSDIAAEEGCSVAALSELAMESRELERKVVPMTTLAEKIDRLSGDNIDNYAMGFTVEAARGKNYGGPTVIAKPMQIGSYVRERVLGEKSLVMSATLPMTETWAKDLGLTNYAIIDVDSVFPPENRPIFFTTVGSMRKGGAERLIKPAAAMVSKILEKFSGEKGIIHTPSYAYNRLLAAELPQARLLYCRSGEDTEDMLAKHMDSVEPTVLVSPAMREGVDLKDHLSRFQVIVKAPFDSLGDPAIKKKSDKNYLWYSQRCLTSTLQAYGRSVRTPTDYARTYILDEDLKMFLRKMRKEVPTYVLDAIHQLD